MADAVMGQSVPRREDQRFLTGAARFTDDFNEPGQLWGAVLRSPHAHAAIKAIETAAAAALPGIIGVYTATDLAADGIGPLPCAVDAMFEFKRRNGSKRFFPTHHVLTRTHVRHVGDPVAFVRLGDGNVRI